MALVAFLAGITGCMENIALAPRPSIVPELQPDVVGTIERVDLAGHQLYLHADAGEARVFAYNDSPRVLYGGREYPISRLAPGDFVSLQLRRDPRGEPYINVIRVERASVTTVSPNQPERAPVITDPSIREQTIVPPRIQTLTGTVQSVNRRDNSFAIDNRPNPIVVALASNARDSDRERFQKLQSGDQVRVEGTFVDGNRFELQSFLDAEY